MWFPVREPNSRVVVSVFTHYAKQTSHNQVSAWFASDDVCVLVMACKLNHMPTDWAVPCMLRICCFAPSAAAAFENTACSGAASMALNG